MAKTVILDEFLLSVRVPADLLDADVDAIRAVLDAADFADRLRRALRAAVAAVPELAPCRVAVTR